MHLQRSQKTWGIKFIEFLNSRISKIIWWSRKLFIKIKCIRSGQSKPPCRIQYLCSLAVVLGGAASECKSNSKSRSWFNRNGAIYFHKIFLKNHVTPLQVPSVHDLLYLHLFQSWKIDHSSGFLSLIKLYDKSPRVRK